ncbi:MAG: DHH family phosphoesterase [Clostridia bacterium]|nr:DHH family phosphoesterase [Clostridia bacterium]
MYSGQSIACDTAIVLDCGDERRLGVRKAIADGAERVINIDHHGTNTFFGDAAYVEPEASATGEILFRLFRVAEIELTRDIARYLYTAICSDTGCFAYSNASPDSFRIAAELIGYGIDHAEIARQLFNCVELGSELLKAELTSSIHSYYGGRLRTVTADEAIAEKYGVDPREISDLVELPRRIRGTEVAVSIKYSGGKLRASLRSNGDVTVDKVALKFGGGGHAKAAGCSIEAPSIDVAEQMIVQAFGELFG